MDNRVLFIGGDKRMIYAARKLSAQLSVDTLGLTEGESELSGHYSTVVLPLPWSRDGKAVSAPLCARPITLTEALDHAEKGAHVLAGAVTPPLEEECRLRGLTLTDYYRDEVLTLKNAALTAEAAVGLLALNTERSLFGSSAVVTGGGRIALLTAGLLRSFGASVTVCARNEIQRARAAAQLLSAADITELKRLSERADIIVNTVPVPLFDTESLRYMNEGAVFMELASLPPLPKSVTEDIPVTYIHAGGLPGRYSPQAAGEAIADALLKGM